MELPAYQPFYLATPDALRAEIQRLGLSVPVEADCSPLAAPLLLQGKTLPNRFCAQPLAGCDAETDGRPSALTRRRYRRYAEGGFGLIWIEATTAGTGHPPAQLALNAGTLDTFRSMVDTMRQASAVHPTILLQLTAAPIGPGQEWSDEAIDRRRDELVQAAGLAALAGFDGIDLAGSQGSLASLLLSAFERPGKYGGSLENRCRFLLETIAEIRQSTAGQIVACRLRAYDGSRNGFGVSATDYRKPDLSEPAQLAQLLHRAGLAILNVTAASPNLRAAPAQRAALPHSDAANPDEHPLMTLDRQLHLAHALREAAPGLAIVGSGFSWLRQFFPHVAAGALVKGWIDFAGLGRGALAYPKAPAEILAGRSMEAGSSCMVCFACSTLQAENQPVGCVIRDGATYGPTYRQVRRFDSDQLLAGARRCHLCEAAPCITASPTHTDIPAFIQAFLDGDESSAFEIIRQADSLPELTAQLSPGWLQSEGACIETTLTGTPVPILDLQYAISWRARDRGETGTRVPAQTTGKRIAIVGGGPAGIAASVRLIEHGHEVDLFESSDRLGGAPERVIPAGRLPEVGAEIEALLRPALTAERLRIHTGFTLGENLALEALRSRHDAVLLATGLWQERSLGKVPGVLDALALLQSAKCNPAFSVPARVAILAGGDSAMDAARTVQQLGAREIFLIFGGPRSAMHWHMPESWFATPGVHTLMNWQPLGFETDSTGQLCGVKIRHAEFAQVAVLAVGLVIEAMGLEVSERVRPVISPINERFQTNLDRVYAAGALVNGGASVAQCVAEAIAAASAIHRELAGEISLS